nr:MAG TPA: hypothetical protein [Caudoviricetes sp.]
MYIKIYYITHYLTCLASTSIVSEISKSFIAPPQPDPTNF